MFILPGVLNGGQGRAEALAETVESLKPLAAAGQEAGVVVCVEPHVHSYLESPALTAEMCERVPGVRLALDYAHFVVAGYRQEEIDPLARWAGHVHLRQARPGALQAKLDLGVINFPALFATLREAGYDGLLGGGIRASGLFRHAPRGCADRDGEAARPVPRLERGVSATVVTGGAGGIGRAIAARLAADGHTVAIADRDGTAAARVAGEIGCDHVEIDIAEEGSVVEGVAAVIARHGGIAALVNNAGVHMQALVVETAVEDWERIQRVNARGTFLMCREAARAMAGQGAGRIVSVVTKLGFGNPYSAAYLASKSAVWALTQCLAVEMAGCGVRVNAVAPGHVGPGTGMEAAFRAKAEKLGQAWEDFEAGVVGSIPLGRWCRPEDVAGAVAWLLGPDAEFVTGEMIGVTGGFQAYAAAPDAEAVRRRRADAAVSGALAGRVALVTAPAPGSGRRPPWRWRRRGRR